MESVEFCSPGGIGSCGQGLGAEKQLSGGEGKAAGVKNKRGVGERSKKGGIWHPPLCEEQRQAPEFGVQNLEPDCTAHQLCELGELPGQGRVNPIRVSYRIPWWLRW